MKKNYRKIPDFILQQIQNIVENELIVATVIRISQNDLANPLYADLTLELENGALFYNQEFVPQSNKGSYSKKNVLGYKIRYPDRPKVFKTYYLGERAIFGDYNRGTFSLFVRKEVTDYDDIPPKEISIKSELLETVQENGQSFYSFKISTSQILDKTDASFNDDLLFNINLLQENFGSIGVFASQANVNEYLQTLTLNWEIFPPGERDQDLNRITNGIRNITPQRTHEIRERYFFLRNENPIQIIIGNSGMRRYFGVRFSDNLVVFENTTYGNALYMLFENWQDLSRLSRTEIQNRPNDQFIRIKHTGNWQEKVRAIIQARR